ncbi:MAG: hypothetical protein R2751_16690 [Bacteroidales bacterium]
MVDFTEEQLIAGVRERNGEVFRYLEQRIKGPMLLYVFNNRGSDQDGQDTWQDSLVVLINLLDDPGFKLNCRMTTFLYAIGERQWKRVLERKGPAENYISRHNEDTFVEGVGDGLDEELKRAIFEDSWKKLGERCKHLLKAFMMDMKTHQVGELLGLTPGTVRKQKSICHAELMKLAHEHPDYKAMEKEGALIGK